MRHLARTFVLVGALAMAGTAFAAAPQSSSSAKKSTPASHTVKGTVKSIDNSSLVISGKKGDMTFALDSTTVKQGSPAVGSDVSVKYHTEGKAMMATAVTAQPAKQVAAAPAKPAASKKTTK
jgi:hypothetical protein